MSDTDITRVYLVRHGVTSWNRAMRMQGHTDIPLDPAGVEQARWIAARIARLPSRPVCVWSSDLARASVTAELIAEPLGVEVQATPLLRETMLGQWEGLTREEIEARGDGERLKDYMRDSYRFRPPGSETLEEVWDRMLRAEALILNSRATGDVVIVGHGGSLRSLLCAALDAPINSMRRLWLDNCSLSIIEEFGQRTEKQRRLSLLNDTSHLHPIVS